MPTPPKGTVTMKDVIVDFASLGAVFEVQKEQNDKLILSAGNTDVDGITLHHGAIEFLGRLDPQYFFVGILKGQLVVREL
jgi:hypothetical protein